MAGFCVRTGNDTAIRGIDSLFTFCSYAAFQRGGQAMDNRINEIRRLIRSLRVSMKEAEAIMHEQINRDEDCTFVAQEILKMRNVMSLLVRERSTLGDNEPILVQGLFIPRRLPTPPRVPVAKCRLMPPREATRA